MIARLTGKLVACTPGQLILDVGGVGYDVSIPLSTFYSVSGGKNSTVSLHVHTHVREDALQLYGFAELEERAVFQRLIGISGVGPKLALAILSGIGVDELRGAVLDQDLKRLQKIPGVGKKTAERLLLELRDKLEIELSGEPVPAIDDAEPARPALRPDAISALVNLGYSRDVAARSVDRAFDEQQAESSLESVLRAALGHLIP